MQEFKVGDKVKRKERLWVGVSVPALEAYEAFTVTAYLGNQSYPVVCFKETGGYQWDAAFFERVEEKPVVAAKYKFAVGDRVISTKDTQSTPEGFIGYITEIDDYEYPIKVEAENGETDLFKEDELELLTASKDFAPREESIARPVLEERKVGKIQMQLFDEGFPNAVLEVSKVMTWAAENKGYKPHDWKNLPNAESEFSAAASRHKLKSLVQKVNEVPASERTDEESNIVHLAHVCFNCLAELELVLTGKIK